MKGGIILGLHLYCVSAFTQGISQTNISRPPRPCIVDYDVIHDLQRKADSFFYDSTFSLLKKIRLSRKYNRLGLEEGYRAISAGYCDEYFIIVDRMIEMANRLERYDEAEALALARLDTVYPGWKDYASKVSMRAEDFDPLTWVLLDRERTSYYQHIRKNKRPLAGCGNDWVDHLSNGKKLLSAYGNIYCFRYLKSLNLDINITNEDAYQSELFDLLIDCWSAYVPVEQLLLAYNNAPVQETAKHHIFIMGSPRYFIEMDGTRLYFYSKIIDRMKPAREGNYKHPDPEKVKVESLLYKRLLSKAGE